MPYTIQEIKEFVPREQRGQFPGDDPAQNSVLENIVLLRKSQGDRYADSRDDMRQATKHGFYRLRGFFDCAR